MSFEIQNQYTLLSKYSVYLRAKLQMNGRKQGGNLKKNIGKKTCRFVKFSLLSQEPVAFWLFGLHQILIGNFKNLQHKKFVQL